MVIETILAIGAGVRAAPAPLKVGSGQSFNLRSQDVNSGLYLVDCFADFSTSSNAIIRSPRMHDNVNCIYLDLTSTDKLLNFQSGMLQPMIQQDNISYIGGIGGDAAKLDNLFTSFYYDNLTGAPGDFVTWDAVKSRIKNLISVPIVLTPSLTGDWGTELAINSSSDLFKANTDYAILGALSGGFSSVISVMGPCTGNVRYGIPSICEHGGNDSRYCVDLSIKSGLATIPIMSSADKNNTFISVADPAGFSISGTIFMAELGAY